MGGRNLHASSDRPQQYDLQLFANDCSTLQMSRVGDEGLKRYAKSPDVKLLSEIHATKSGAVDAHDVEIETSLRAVMDAWPDQSQEDRDKIIAIVELEDQ